MSSTASPAWLRLVAAGWLGLGWGVVSFILLAVEPGMGFEGPEDFFDPAKVAEGYQSLAWLADNVVMLGFPVAIILLVRGPGNTSLVWSGMIAAVLLSLVAAIDRVGIQLSGILPTREEVEAAVASMLPVRFAMQKAGVVALGVFAFSTTRSYADSGWAGTIWRVIGWVTISLCVVSVFAFMPIPLAFFVWGLGLTVRELAAPRS